MKSLNTPNKLSRRIWLRNAAITATSAAVLPSLLTSCSDHQIPPDVGVSDPSLLRSAAQNLLHMNAWIQDVYPFCIEYELAVYALLKSGEKPTNWTDFIIDVLVDIAVGILEAASVENPFAVPAIAIAGASIKQWILAPERPAGLDGQFAEFALGHNRMQKAISDTLLTLADETDNYKNLREGFKEAIPFNGKNYTLNDLAGSQFPTKNKGTEYVNMRTAAYDRFRKYLWNMMIMKAGALNYSAVWSETWERLIRSPTFYGRNKHYKDYPATYLRGWYLGGLYYFRYWYFTFDDREMSAAAATELFKDDTPENSINPDGLFNRDYVFKQFRRERPNFFGYHELKKNPRDWALFSNEEDFDLPDNFEFTGGDFPQLVKR